MQGVIASTDRLNLKLSSSDKQLLQQAAAIEGISVAAFVRSAAKQRAAAAIQLERAVTLSRRDYETFHAALAEPFRPNEALSQALNQVVARVQRV
ncbi:DUF1778 domain-containing protein [Synechococcus sp. CS-205]|nr:DUF1778 domain-containing protein [Synechococcus sp. CS-205]